MSDVLEPRDLGDLDALSAGWDPFSRETELWHSCPGHEWERIDWARDRANGRVTRCSRCGAPRCDAFDVPDDWVAALDEEKQRFRCTSERHHPGDHDYLHGARP